ncbi:hypothetical protein G6F23_014962 [Rhizopus arrhizus]|nr:hypothetical protein G6F23_014962 [Rhizopus arrhizus]
MPTWLVLSLASRASSARLIFGAGSHGGLSSPASSTISALPQDVALAQRQHAALEVRNAAAAQVLFDHPQVHVFHALEAGVLHGVERQAVLLADAEAVVAVDQHIAPQHQRIAAAFGQQAALQRFVLGFGRSEDRRGG